MKPLLGCAALILVQPLSAGRAQPPPLPGSLPGDVMMQHYLDQQADLLAAKYLDGAETLAQWEQKRPRLHQEYLDMLGLWPLPDKTPLHVKVTGSIATPDSVVEKLHFQSKPGLYVTGNLYRPVDCEAPSGQPGGATRPYPAIVYLCGHINRGRDGNKSEYQDHGMWFARNGYVCLVLDSLQLGEIPGIHHGLKLYGRWWWQALGYSATAVECWNGIRAIDYLVSRPDVDGRRIGVTGISGGGAASFWIAAADERNACAVPVSGMSDLEGYVQQQLLTGHCDCSFPPNTYRLDWTTIAALIAPRPLLFCDSDKDPIFPLDGHRRIDAKLQIIAGSAVRAASKAGDGRHSGPYAGTRADRILVTFKERSQ
jgi:dienelactone hydrolase